VQTLNIYTTDTGYMQHRPWISCQSLSSLSCVCFPACRCLLPCHQAETDQTPLPDIKETHHTCVTCLIISTPTCVTSLSY